MARPRAQPQPAHAADRPREAGCPAARRRLAGGELIAAEPGVGEFSLLFPALAELGQDGQWLVLIDPPWIPYPAALRGHGLALERLLWVRTGSAKESLWACEQALAATRGGAVLAWPELAWSELARKPIGFARLRRLQLAAEAGAKPAFLFRPEHAGKAASPAALRLHLAAGDGPEYSPEYGPEYGHYGTRIDILKCRGERPRDPAWLPPRHPFTPIDIPSAANGPDTGSPPTSAVASGPHRLPPGPVTIN